MNTEEQTELHQILARLKRLEDVHELTQLRARYCQALDDGRWEALVDTFTPDGEFVGLSAVKGHQELLSFFPTLKGSSITSWWHFSSNESLEVTGDTASGTTWLLQPCVVDGESQIAAGRYTDSMVRTATGWKFQQRKVSFFFWASLEDGWDAGRFSWQPAEHAADQRTLQQLSRRSAR